MSWLKRLFGGKANQRGAAQEEAPMMVIAGLGNPGTKYAHTRHNCGYDALDVLAKAYQIPVSQNRFQGLCGAGYVEGKKVLLIKPLTYMNLSGTCLKQACDYYHIDPAGELIVLCDDISLPPGHLRIRTKGSAGGHNGLKHIIAQLGTQEFLRIRIGVGEKPEGYDLADFVLSHFHGEEKLEMAQAFDLAARAAAELTFASPQQVMSKYNTPRTGREKRD